MVCSRHLKQTRPWVLEKWQATQLWKKRWQLWQKEEHSHSANLWLIPKFPLALLFGTVFVQKNSTNSMSRHTPIHCILTNNNFRSFSSLNSRNFYWTLQAALEPKPRFIAALGTKHSRGSHLRNSVRLNQKITGSTKQRTTSWMKCFNDKRWKLPPKWNLPPRWNLLSPKQLGFQQVPRWELRLFWSDSRRLKAITKPHIFATFPSLLHQTHLQ